ncbi:hypothetical protein G9A89_000633 [Geosiphon pyriformis]|nr:hypothetical protein G9A89_000633 [Geosiphon pyriformis]
MNKSHTIRSVLKHPFCKMVLNHLVVDDELILEPDLVKFKVDIIMERWTRKHGVIADVSDVWSFFSGVMHSVKFNKLLDVISDLPNGKAADLLSITNELWKHCDKSILNMLLVLLNLCLSCKSVLRAWKETWVLIISKPHE